MDTATTKYEVLFYQRDNNELILFTQDPDHPTLYVPFRWDFISTPEGLGVNGGLLCDRPYHIQFLKDNIELRQGNLEDFFGHEGAASVALEEMVSPDIALVSFEPVMQKKMLAISLYCAGQYFHQKVKALLREEQGIDQKRK